MLEKEIDECLGRTTLNKMMKWDDKTEFKACSFAVKMSSFRSAVLTNLYFALIFYVSARKLACFNKYILSKSKACNFI